FRDWQILSNTPHAGCHVVCTGVFEYLQSLYPNGGTTLFCNQAFSHKSNRLTAGYIYSLKAVREELQCRTNTECKRDSEMYRAALTDLHNTYPIMTRVELKRRDTVFGNVRDTAKPLLPNCSLQEDYLVLEPADAIKGDVARALLYMHDQYNLPLQAPLETLLEWNNIDKPDDQEVQRNNTIADLQGIRNRFIDDPALAAQLASRE
ncbi:endonuclease, partial [Kistimonas scapharcae]|uniref:endonuclease n=1 Tax=Kistimonas scapharcae TaxID=1036133 RepID=UPI0031E78EE6